MQVPKRKSEENRKIGPDDHFLTEEKIARLKAQLVRLDEIEKPKALADLQEAQAAGDLSENAAYTEAKARLRRINGKMLSIKERLKHAIVIKKGPGKHGEVQIGSTVTVEVNGKEKVFEITGAQESEPGRGKISYHSPVGSALIDAVAGDEVGVDIGERTIIYRIKKVA